MVGAKTNAIMGRKKSISSYAEKINRKGKRGKIWPFCAVVRSHCPGMRQSFTWPTFGGTFWADVEITWRSMGYSCMECGKNLGDRGNVLLSVDS